MCWLQYSPLDCPDILKEASVVQPSILQWGWTISIMPGSLCLLQNLPLVSPKWLKRALVLQPSNVHTRTMSSHNCRSLRVAQVTDSTPHNKSDKTCIWRANCCWLFLCYKYWTEAIIGEISEKLGAICTVRCWQCQHHM